MSFIQGHLVEVDTGSTFGHTIGPTLTTISSLTRSKFASGERRTHKPRIFDGTIGPVIKFDGGGGTDAIVKRNAY
jgi:hypothetical protein